MDWNQFVGERFRSLDGKLFHVQSFEPSDNSFCLNDVSKPSLRTRIPVDMLTTHYSMVVDCEPPQMIKSIKNHRDGNQLIDMALLNLSMEIPVHEQTKMYRKRGFSYWDIYLTIKAAQQIMKETTDA